MDPVAGAGLMERRRAQTRHEIEVAAADLFEAQGYDATTVEQIAARAGVSLRTFYRYFPSKEEAITSDLVGGPQRLADLVDERGDLSLVDALVAGLLGAVGFRIDLVHRRRLTRVTVTTPALRGRWLTTSRETGESLTPVIARRLPCLAPIEVTALAAATSAALTAAVELWSTAGHGAAAVAAVPVAVIDARVGGEAEELAAVARRCLDALRPALER